MSAFAKEEGKWRIEKIRKEREWVDIEREELCIVDYQLADVLFFLCVRKSNAYRVSFLHSCSWQTPSGQPGPVPRSHLPGLSQRCVRLVQRLLPRSRGRHLAGRTGRNSGMWRRYISNCVSEQLDSVWISPSSESELCQKCTQQKALPSWNLRRCRSDASQANFTD